jgi:hypothetical protein
MDKKSRAAAPLVPLGQIPTEMNGTTRTGSKTRWDVSTPKADHLADRLHAGCSLLPHHQFIGFLCSAREYIFVKFSQPARAAESRLLGWIPAH